MNSSDFINFIFEISGGFFVLLSILATHKAKKIEGVSILMVLFFTSWGYWNLYYYPSLGQLLSGLGAASVALANTFWLCQIMYYKRRIQQTSNKEVVSATSSLGHR